MSTLLVLVVVVGCLVMVARVVSLPVVAVVSLAKVEMEIQLRLAEAEGGPARRVPPLRMEVKEEPVTVEMVRFNPHPQVPRMVILEAAVAVA